MAKANVKQNVAFGETRDIIAETLKRLSSGIYFPGKGVERPDSNLAWINYQAEAEVVGRSLFFDDGGTNIIEHEYKKIPLCKKHK